MLFDAESESTKQEIFDLLLAAGYFRIRIPSLNDFDKVLGGLSWGILCSGFDIDLDLEYSDEFQLGQKIKLSERVVKGLKTMKCPHPLLPHQIRGLDYNAIFPVTEWLLKFVDATRQELQDTNQKISSEIGDRLIYKRRNYFELPSVPNAKVSSKNTNISSFTRYDPIRVYSSLAELGDKKAAAIYQQICTMRKEKELEESKNQKKNAMERKLEREEAAKLNPSGDFTTDLKSQLLSGVKAMGNSSSKTGKTTASTTFNSAEATAIEESSDIEEVEGFQLTRKLKRKGTIDQDQFLKIIEEQQEDNEDLVEKLKEIETAQESEAGNAISKEAAVFEEQRSQLESTIKKQKSKVKEMKVVLGELMDTEEAIVEEHTARKEKNETFKETLKTIDVDISSRKDQIESEEMEKIEDLISEIVSSKEKKSQIKATAKEETKKKSKQIKKLKKKLAELEENEMVETINQEYEERKAIYSKKQEDLAQISKEVALLQRKVQEYPNSIELSQYYKRYADLFDKVATETEVQRKLDTIFNRKCDIQRLCSDHSGILNTLRGKIQGCKKQKHREEVIGIIENVIDQTAVNLKRSKSAADTAVEEHENMMKELDSHLGYQREYFQLLKRIQYEYEKLQNE